MNAFTSSDHTTYPFATTNRQDFNNLMSVYLDATLHPLLNESDFKQEGWRVGPDNPSATLRKDEGNTDSKLVFKGVVYNEMKGQMSDASYLYYIKYQESIFPEIHNSGGDPRHITSLTYEDLKAFHAQNYHPTNAKLFTYGDMPLADHLMEVGRQLDRFERGPLDKAIKLPLDLTKGPFALIVDGPIDPLVNPDMQYKTSTSWLMGDTAEFLESFSFSVMSSLLLDGYGSPLHRNLIEAGLGPEWSSNTGYDSTGKIGIFAVGLNGVRESDVPKVKDTIQKTLREIYQRGFDKGKVDGLLHQFELGLKHKTANFGMGLMQRIQPGWFNGVDPLGALAWQETVSAFKQKLAEERYLEGLLDKHLLNDQTLTFTMKPSETYWDDIAKEEAARLTQKVAMVAAEAGGEIQAQKQLMAGELELVKAQESARNQDVSCLPTLILGDIPRKMERKEVRDTVLGKGKIQWREASTNGLTYFRALHLVETLPSELRQLIPLFCDALMRLGTRGKTIEELEDLIKLKTGGIQISYYASTSPTSLLNYSEGLSFSGYALDHNIPALYELLRTLVQETNFDGREAESKIRQLLEGEVSGALNAIASSGHSYARRYAEAGLTPQGLLIEQTAGLTQVQQVAMLAKPPYSEDLGLIITKLKSIQRFAISNSGNFRAALTCGQKAVPGNEAALQSFLSNLPTATTVPQCATQPGFDVFSSKTFFPLPYQVYYSAMALPTVPFVHRDSAPLQVLSQLLTHKHLHHEIREKGGAYGGGAYARGLSGVFGYYSYRDPNPLKTVETMQDAGRWACDKQWSDRDLEEAKLSVFQAIDAPESVSEEGMTRFLSGVDEEMEQRKREALLDVRKQDLANVAEKYLTQEIGQAKLAILGERQEWVKEGEEYNVKQLQIMES
jgi:presequence protease